MIKLLFASAFLIVLLLLNNVWSLDMLRIQIINDTPEMLVNFTANLTLGIPNTIPKVINPYELGTFSAKYSTGTNVGTKGFLSFSFAGPSASPFILGWIWKETSLDFRVGIVGNDANSLYIQNTFTIETFLSIYQLLSSASSTSTDWIYKSLISQYDVKLLIKPGLIIVHLFPAAAAPVPSLQENAYYYVTNFKTPTSVLENQKDVNGKSQPYQAINQGRQTQQFLIFKVPKPNLATFTAPGNVYLVLDRSQSLALTAFNATLLTMEPIKGTQAADYSKQYWYIENLFDNSAKVFTLRNGGGSNTSNVITSTSAGNLVLWALAVTAPGTNLGSNYKLYFDYINTWSSNFVDNQICKIKQWRNSTFVIDLWAESLPPQQNLESVYKVQEWAMRQTDCNGTVAYQFTEQGFGNSIVIDNSTTAGVLKGAAIGPATKTREKWLLIPSSDHYNMVYWIQNCGTLQYLKTPADFAYGGNYTLSTTRDTNSTLFTFQKLMGLNSPPHQILVDVFKNDYHYFLATGSSQELKLTAWADVNYIYPLNLTLAAVNLSTQAWFFAPVTIGTTTGYFIMNERYGLALTKIANKTVADFLYSPLETDQNTRITQLWTVENYIEDYSDSKPSFNLRNLGCTEKCFLSLNDMQLRNSTVNAQIGTRTKKKNINSNPVDGSLDTVTYYTLHQVPSVYPYVLAGNNDGVVWSTDYNEVRKNKAWILKATNVTGNYYLQSPLDEKNLKNEAGTWYLSVKADFSAPELVIATPTTNMIWNFIPDPDYYNLYFFVKSVRTGTYLTGPSPMVSFGLVTLAAMNETNKPRQRWRLSALTDKIY